MTITLHHGDCVTWAREYSGEPFHALLTDAPYEMAFMGKSWDASGVAFDPETWRAFARVLYPGAFLFVFAGTINDDLISVAMREAGLRKFHKMAGWVFGSGFPKATRIDTQIDRAAGAEREIVGRSERKMTGSNWSREKQANLGYRPNGAKYPGEDGADITAPATPLAQAFAGHRYGLQALKPALETVLIFQKPYEGRPVDNITATGAGALNIEGSRIGLTDYDVNEYIPNRCGWKDGIDYKQHSPKGKNSATYGNRDTSGQVMNKAGRYPANFYLDAEAARRLDEQSGERHSYGPYRKSDGIGTGDGVTYMAQKPQGTVYSDSGGASRFFFRVNEQIDDADPVRYVAKASRAERDAGLDGFELQERGQRYGLDNGGALPKQTPHKHEPTRNPHPTVKPLALCKYLATLLLPPAEYAPRRLFVPFAGVGSECIGAMQAGWEHVEGVEITEEYLPIARARVEYWQEKAAQSQMELPL